MSEQYHNQNLVAEEPQDPIIQRTNAWEVSDATADQMGRNVLIRDEGAYVGLDVIPVALDGATADTEQATQDHDTVRRQRHAVAEAISKVLHGAEEPGQPATAGSPLVWVGFNGLRAGNKLSAAKLNSVEETPDGEVVFKVLDKEGNVSLVPATARVVPLTERQKGGGYAAHPQQSLSGSRRAA